MISKHAIKRYLDRKLDNFDWIKDFKKKELALGLKELRPVPKFGKIKLWMHQKACFLLMVYMKRFMLFLDMGAGKTLLCLMVLKYRKRCGEKPKAIVFVPFVTTVSTWIDEVEEHTPELKCVPLIHGRERNLELLANEKADLFVICYQSAVSMISDKYYNHDKGKNEWNFEAKDVYKLFKQFDMMVLDECHKIKNHLSLAYKMCRAITKRCEYVYGLTGTPFGRDLLDLWAQFYIVDLGDTLGTTLGMYRECLFNKRRGWFGGTEYKFKKKYFDKLQEMIKNRSIRYSIDECYDMPAKIFHVKDIEPTEDMMNYGQSSVKKLQKLMRERGQVKNYQAIKNTFILILQLSSGFMTFKAKDTDRVKIEFDENPKLDALIELIDTMPPESKMVVFHNWVHSNTLISERLTQHKIGHARVYGKQKNSIAELKRFKQNKTCRVLVINSKSGSSSLNLQHANYVVFFEQPRSSIDRQQAERRCWRPGQKKKVLFFDLIMRGTFDKRQKDNNDEGRDLLKGMLDGKEKVESLFTQKDKKKKGKIKRRKVGRKKLRLRKAA